MMRKAERTALEAEEDAINLLEDVSAVISGDADLEGRLRSIEKRLKLDASEKIKPRRGKRMVSVRLAVLLSVLAVAGTAFALTQTTLTAEQIELFNSQSAVTDFTVSSFTSTPSGDNDLTIEVILDNDDTGSAHFANVTVNIMNSAGDEIANQTLATGSVAASGQVTLTFTFAQANIVPDYDSAQIVVKQSS